MVNLQVLRFLNIGDGRHRHDGMIVTYLGELTDVSVVKTWSSYGLFAHVVTRTTCL